MDDIGLLLPSTLFATFLPLISGINEKSVNSLLRMNPPAIKWLPKGPSTVEVIETELPSASTMGKLANMKYKKSDFEDVAYFEPYYLKDFVALKTKKN